MRKLVVIVLAFLVVPAAALAREVDKGDGTLAVSNASGVVLITAGKGSILGRLEEGTIRIVDGNPYDRNALQVSGADRPPLERGIATTVYKGDGMRFRFVGGRYTIRITGTGIGLAAVGSGRVRIVGLGTLDDGSFSIDGAPFRALSLTPFVGGFGQAPLPIPAAGG